VADEFKRGDRVEWKFGRGKAVGVVRRKLTSRTEVGGQVVAASKDDPRYLVETERSQKQAAKRPEVLKRIDK
jgi:Hypervirulence associated proteins TUDOR domain